MTTAGTLPLHGIRMAPGTEATTTVRGCAAATRSIMAFWLWLFPMPCGEARSTRFYYQGCVSRSPPLSFLPPRIRV